eukprot:TRINITY_DN650_c0_g1_i4.p1 TRINITY_DN650_c0_g1~~TRINITY_DN650_c0_g1_i4.p1  ORF type:complete len:324 (-),score=47.72 TRINITY_DN650_c0_g1_i4:407-1378(-)
MCIRDRYQRRVHGIKKVISLFQKLPIPDGFYQFLYTYSENYELKYPEFVQEIKGIAQAVDEPFDIVFMLNFFYEISSFKACTTIIARNKDNQIIQGRNLDYFLWHHFSKLLSEIDVYSGDDYVYTMQVIVGSVFTTTGVKPGKFMINEDTRKNHQGIFDIITGTLINEFIPAAYLIRRILEEETVYENALNRLMYENISTTVYYMISGTESNQGAVIERSSQDIHAYKELDDNTWYLVKTNYDFDQKEPWDDHRVEYANKYMKKLGQSVTAKTLQSHVLGKWPLLNIATIMTVISNNNEANYTSVGWYKVESQHDDAELDDFE